MRTYEGEDDGCLGVDIKRTEKVTILKQPQLIERALLLLDLKEAR